MTPRVSVNWASSTSLWLVFLQPGQTNLVQAIVSLADLTLATIR